MGYCIPIVQTKIEQMPEIMQSIGLPVISSETRPDGDYFFCKNPKRPRARWVFWITPEEEGRPRFFKCGLSRFSQSVVRSLASSGIFETVAQDHPTPDRG